MQNTCTQTKTSCPKAAQGCREHPFTKAGNSKAKPFKIGKLLTKSNAKIEKSIQLGYITEGLHLAPYDLSGYQVCQFASAGCAAACLNTAGRGRMQNVQDARIKKTRLFFKMRTVFLHVLFDEVQKSVIRAEKKGLKACFRLNLTSDLPWEKFKLSYNGNEPKSIFETFPQVQFYDYTKSAARMQHYLESSDFPKNYHLTFSRSESNAKDVESVLNGGGNVAAVFRDRLPKTWQGKEVIDGDEHDLRFLDKRGVIVGLVEKGLAKKDATGFVIN